jgi:hypothetical protein
VARVASEHTGGVDDGRLTAATRQHLDNDVLEVRITVLAVKFPPERGVGKVFAGRIPCSSADRATMFPCRNSSRSPARASMAGSL